MSAMVDMGVGPMACILCCMCGVQIQQNPANMCMNCLRDNFDITEGITKQLTIHSCRTCTRFLLPPWSEVKLESKELLAACLRKISGLNKVKLIDAAWIWTEPHSLRLKIKLVIQKEIMNGAVLQQSTIVEFVIRNQQCLQCQASFATGAWEAVVQVRQRVSHKRTFFFLEQLLLKHHAHTECVNIVTFHDGIDFYFGHKQHALRFIDFLGTHIPIKSKFARKLISADRKSNIGKYKNNFMVEIAPVCKDDLLLLPNELARNLSSISPLVLVKAVTSNIHVVDPLTGERQEIDVEKYWRYEFTSAMSGRDLTRFIVLSIEPVIQATRAAAKKRGTDRKMRMVECVVVREDDLGSNDQQFTCLTNLGHILKEGDTVVGFDLSRFSLTSLESEVDAYLAKKDLPDVVLVRKVYATKAQRKWKLRSMEYDEDQASPNARDAELREQDYEGFLQEIEGDKEMRANINLYKAESATATATATANSNTNTTTSASMTQSIKKSASGRNKGSKVSTSKKASKASSTTANGASKGGKTSGDGNEEGEWEDMDEDGDRFDGDEEAIRLDELLDEMTLTPLSHRGATTNANTTNAPTGDADASADTGNLDGAHALESDDLLLLSPQDANSIAPVVLSTSGFDAADFNLSSVKFK